MPMIIDGTNGATFPNSTVQTTGFSSGDTDTTSAVSITLTSASTLTQNVAMTAVNNAVILPAATTITRLGIPVFTINNTGAYHFYIQLSAGGYINQVAPGGSVTLSLADNTTSDGKWVQSDLGYTAYKMYDYQSFSLPSAQISASGASSPPTFDLTSVTPLSATTFFITFKNTQTVALYGVVATLSGTTISYGTPVFIDGATGVRGVLKYSSTTGIVLVSVSASQITMYPFSISGSTITIGSFAAITGIGMLHIPIDGQTLSSTLAVVAQYNSTGSTTTLRTVQLNALAAPTLGTATTIVSGGANGVALAVVSATTAVVVYGTPSVTPIVTSARVATFSGTSAPTLGTAVSLGTDVNNLTEVFTTPLYVALISGTEYSVSQFGSSSYQKTITVSGTTVSSPTTSVPVPAPSNASQSLSTSNSCNPKFINSTTGIMATPSTAKQSNPQQTITMKEVKYVSGYGFLLGLNIPSPTAYYTPTGLNQSEGLNAGNISTVYWNVLDSSTMLLTTNGTNNGTFAFQSTIIKPTT